MPPNKTDSEHHKPETTHLGDDAPTRASPIQMELGLSNKANQPGATHQSADNLGVSENTTTPLGHRIIPGHLQVIKRNGAATPYDEAKISLAMNKAFIDTLEGLTELSSSVRSKITMFANRITLKFQQRMPSGGAIHIEDIQDWVEMELMRNGEQKVARSYVLYREERTRLRQEKQAEQQPDQNSNLQIKRVDGSHITLSQDVLKALATSACEGIDHVSVATVLSHFQDNLHNGINEDKLILATVTAVCTLVEQEPNYSYVVARLLLNNLYQKSLRFLAIPLPKDTNVWSYMPRQKLDKLYPKAFTAFIKRAIKLEYLDPRLQKQFDLQRLAAELKPERDLQFNYLGLQTLIDRYFIHDKDIRFEMPQIFFMRIAMGLSIAEDDPNARAIEFYNTLSTFLYMSSTPTLFNAGTLKPQLSSCYLSTIPDNLDGIFSALKDNALLSKWAGGLGNDWTPVRALHSYIKGTNGRSQGVVPFMKVANDTALAVNQGGKRKGAICAYLETWHLDIEEFLELRKNTGDDRRRTHDMNSANWIPDLFMKRVINKQHWTLFSPVDTPDLHDLTGVQFDQRYKEYERMADAGEISLYKRLEATKLWQKMLTMLFETGHPWITFKDACNLRSPQQHVGVVHSSNLCTEITLNTKAGLENKEDEEIAVCNLGSVNLAAHTSEQGLNLELLKKTVSTAIRMLDNVIDINLYAVPQARNANLKHRAIGLGMMGFQDALYKQRISFASEQAVEFADTSTEAISYFAIKASADLATERGRYESFEGSLWDQGILPLDSLDILAKARGTSYLNVDRTTRLDWDTLREHVRAVGMRNSNVLAIAPTATIANIVGVSPCIEPTYRNLYVKSNLSGEFTTINPYLAADLKAAGIWDTVMVSDLKYFDGNLAKIDRISDKLKELYTTAFEIEPRWIIEAGSRRQKWLDQSQSLNLWMSGQSGRQLDEIYRMAWYSGLKTTYYLRSNSATSVEKSTVARNNLNDVLPVNPQPDAPSCAIEDPECESCQ